MALRAVPHGSALRKDIGGMNGTLRVKDEPAHIIEAMVVPGSDYPIAYAPGAKVELQLDPSTDQVIVTRGRGLVKLANVSGPKAASVAVGLRQGSRYTGRIAAVGIARGGKLLQISLDRPPRGPAISQT